MWRVLRVEITPVGRRERTKLGSIAATVGTSGNDLIADGAHARVIRYRPGYATRVRARAKTEIGFKKKLVLYYLHYSKFVCFCETLICDKIVTRYFKHLRNDLVPRLPRGVHVFTFFFPLFTCNFTFYRWSLAVCRYTNVSTTFILFCIRRAAWTRLFRKSNSDCLCA